MKPAGILPVFVQNLLDWVTNVNLAKLATQFASRLRGVRQNEAGFVVNRDFGTIQRYSSYPSTPDPEPEKDPIQVVMKGGYTLYDPEDAAEFEIVAALDPPGDANSRMRLFAGDTTVLGNWKELTRQVVCKIAGIAGQVITIYDPRDDLGNVIVLADHELKGWTVRNSDVVGGEADKETLVKDNAVLSITTAPNTVDLGWTNDNQLRLVQSPAILHTYNYANGAEPHLRWIGLDDQRSAMLLYGDSNLPVGKRIPVLIQSENERKYFFNVFGNEAFSLPKGFYLEMGGGLIPSFTEVGTAKVPLVTGDAIETTIEDPVNNPWLYVRVAVTSSASGKDSILQKIYVTCVYNGFQESDPILKAYLNLNSATPDSPLSGFLKARINPARMPKNLTSLRIYVANKDIDTGVASFADWIESAAEYQRYYEILINEKPTDAEFLSGTAGWTPDFSDDNYRLLFPGAGDIETNDPNIQGISLVESLGHQPIFERERIQARFGDKSPGAGGTLVVLDGDDRTLYVSTITGSGAPTYNNFIKSTVDSKGRPILLSLNGQGELKGIAVAGNAVGGFYRSTVTLNDLRTGVLVTIIQVDCWASSSIFPTGEGIDFAGQSGLYMLSLPNEINPSGLSWKEFAAGTVEPASRGPVLLLNPNWKNWYDGTLKTGDGISPFLTQQARKAILTGYEPTFREKIFFMRALDENGDEAENLLVRFNGKGWTVRPVPFIVRWFSQRKDGTLTIGTEDSILMYPNRELGNIYEDALAPDGTSSGEGKGVETLVRLNVGEVYDLRKLTGLYSIYIDCEGESIDGQGYFEVRFYRDGNPVPYDEQKFFIDRRQVPRLLKQRGLLKELEIEIEIPASQRGNMRELKISTIKLETVPQPNLVSAR